MEIHFNPHMILQKPPEKARKTASVGFGGVLHKTDGTPQGVEFGGTIETLAHLTALPDVSNPAGQEDKRSGGKHGKAMLALLDDVRLGLLRGGVSLGVLESLGAFVRQKRSQHTQDAALRALLQDIEVRAAVELAKFQRDEK